MVKDGQKGGPCWLMVALESACLCIVCCRIYTEAEYDDQEEIEQENNVRMDVVKPHPVPSPEDNDSETGNSYTRLSRLNACSETVYLYPRFGIVSKIYMTILLIKNIIECGAELRRDGEMKAMNGNEG